MADLFLVFVLHFLWSKFNKKGVGGGECKIHKSLHSEIHQSMSLSLGSISFSKGKVLPDVMYPPTGQAVDSSTNQAAPI